MKASPPLIAISIVIISILILLVQNLGTIIQISFLGFTSLPLPLSLAMLLAFLSGGITAALWNQVAEWLRDRLEPTENEEESIKEEDDEYYDDDDDDIIEVEYIDR